MSSPPRHVILLGAAGTGTAFGAACALRRVWSQEVRLVAIDINPSHLVTTSTLSDVFVQVPPFTDPGFPGTLGDLMNEHGVDTYLPLFPEEIALGAELQETSRLPAGVTVLAPTVTGARACSDKWELKGILERAGVPQPKTALATDPFAADRYFLKPRSGTGSQGVRSLAADQLSSATADNPEKWIVQEECTGPEVTVDSFVDPGSGFAATVCRERLEVKTGVCTKARLFGSEELEEVARGIAGALGLAGSFCFQVMRNSLGWAVTDVNPRPGAATAMGVTTGNDFFAAHFARAWGEDVQRFFRPLVGEHFVTRQYAEFPMNAPE